jgi:hypothetical protein
MKNYPLVAYLLRYTKRMLMLLGALLFLSLSALTIARTGTPDAARQSNDPQPELQAMAPFSR